MDSAPTYSTVDAIGLADRVEALNNRYSEATATDIIHTACVELFPDRMAAVSSFGAEAAVLLHMIAETSPATPVVFLDTHKHFSATREYVGELARELGLGVVVTAYPSKGQTEADDPDGGLCAHDTDRCCHIRKTLPMMRALRPYRAFFTGRKRFQTDKRQDMQPFEAYGRWIRINPLWRWNAGELRAYMEKHRLPKHPLVADGYLSIGCAPCTKPVEVGQDPRAGRWADEEKTECGIHIMPDGRIQRHQ